MTEREYQNAAKISLERIYDDVVVQWHPFLGQGRKSYAPIVDIAVGPFAIEGQHGDRYSELVGETRNVIEMLIEMHNQNVEDAVEQTSLEQIRNFNYNARCFLCIEVEDTGSRKHLLGDLVNASALGRIGVLVARSERAFKAFLRQRVYLRYLADVGKNTFRSDNALVLTAEQFDYCLMRING